MEDDSPRAAKAADDEELDDTPDWTQFAAFARTLKKNSDNAADIIPKRGEKDYAPVEQFADRQASALEKSRNAMYSALEAGSVRSHSSKQHNRATWHPDIARAAMDPKHMASIHFKTMGRYHSGRKRTELLPEEALYLVERGTLECWTEEGVPMSAQQAYVEMIGTERLTFEHYQIYAYLRRLGYAVLRADLASLLPPVKPFTATVKAAPLFSSFLRLWRHLRDVLRTACNSLLVLTGLALPHLNGPGPGRRKLRAIDRRGLLDAHRWRSYDRLFSALAIIPTGHDLPLAADQPATLPKAPLDEPYRIFFHVYKPITRFPKTAPPPPDYYIAIINARETPLFDLIQATTLLQSVPFSDPVEANKPRKSLPPSRGSARRAGWRSWLPFFASIPRQNANVYPRLKAGRRSVVVAVVDSGTSSFIRFAEGDFAGAPWLGEGR